MGYLHFAFLGQESFWAAEASECAAEQEKFWEYHNILYQNQGGENENAFSLDNLKAFAAQIGLDSAAFDECLDSGRYREVVQEEVQVLRQIGVESTPTFLINGQGLVGLQDFSTFERIIEEQLAGN